MLGRILLPDGLGWSIKKSGRRLLRQCRPRGAEPTCHEDKDHTHIFRGVKLKPDFQFDESSHTYRLNGDVIPGTTDIIKECVGSGFEYLQDAAWYLQRGRAVHAAAKFIAEGKPFECDPRIEGRVNALRKWFADHQPHDFICEQPVFSATYRYAGTPDLVCLIQNRPHIVDWKNSLDEARLSWQVSAYGIAIKAPAMTRGLGVELHDDGSYRMTAPIDLRRFGQEFLAMRSVYSIKERLGQLKKEQNADQ